MLRFWQFSAGAQAVQSFQFVDATRSFLHVNGSKSAITCILRSVRKPTLVTVVRKAYRIDLILCITECAIIFGTFEVGKPYLIDLKL